VSKDYPNPIIFQALGDYYLQEGKRNVATVFYKKALMTPSEISRYVSANTQEIYS
jgi:hypothetical protein